MKNADFGQYLRTLREDKGIPQRKVAQRLDIDTSTLSKIELGERPLLLSMLAGLAEVLDVDFKELQIKYISESILFTFEGQLYLKEALKKTLKSM
ncbi:helix-turn-helix domain-containing protein [Cyclobacterium sp. SYSU L10401]|uniref:helix-turn-helix domain-containing protein n=1 Tax=Cyclobacterium sp. SYSU L10401 TaxID=2678657 RepID=UPI0013D40636|nr:helix-turn-helix transcriptional regulator [Cyclobacterium sp. SYSU L10401]